MRTGLARLRDELTEARRAYYRALDTYRDVASAGPLEQRGAARDRMLEAHAVYAHRRDVLERSLRDRRAGSIPSETGAVTDP